METRSLNKDSLMVGEGVILEGKVTTVGNVDVRGVLKGEVIADSIHVWSTGSIEGSVSANSMIVEGRVGSKIVVAGDLAIKASGILGGSVSYQTIEIEKGAVIKSRLSCTTSNTRYDNEPSVDASEVVLGEAADAELNDR